jgi:hypothetical protein
MVKIKGIGRLKIEVSKIISRHNRKNFLLKCENWQQEIIKNYYSKVDFEVISLAGHNYFPEQLLSIYNFMRYVGIPNQWTIIDDGTLTDSEIDILDRFGFVSIINSVNYRGVFFEELKEFEKEHVWIRLIFAYFNVLKSTNKPTMFIEADVLVGKKIIEYLHLFRTENFYLPDTGPHFDSKYYNFGHRMMFDVNNGFAIFNHMPNLDLIVNYMVERLRRAEFEYFTPQGAFQLAINEDLNCTFLDPRYFVVSVSDMFKYSRDFNAETVAIRHFVGPCRHKMWQYEWSK